MRRTIVAVACVGAVAGSMAGAGCVDDTSPLAPTFDAAGFDVSAFDAGRFDANVLLPDATARDATTADAAVDAAPSSDSAAPADTGVDAPADAGTADTGTADAGADTGPSVDAGAGTVINDGGLTMTDVRQGHSATLLGNGHVLFCGGYFGSSGSLASCDDFDPVTNTVSAGPSLHVGRQSHTAVVLANGQVLFAGGAGVPDGGAFDALRSAEIYDPATKQFTLVASPMAQARSGGGAVLVTTGASAGKVILVGGNGDRTFDSGVANDTSLDTAEVFDPGADATKGTFTMLGAHLSARRGGSMTAAALPEGGVLAAGGSFGPGGGPYTYLATAETLDPALTAFTATTNTMTSARQGAASVLLATGAVFVANGTNASGYPATADVFDPTTRAFTGATLPAPRAYMAMATLKSGRVLIAGGVGGTGTLGDVIVYDPVTKAFLGTTGTLNPPRALATATTLPDGRVLIAGGQQQSGFITGVIDVFKE